MDDNVEGSVENTRQWLGSAYSFDNDDKEHKRRLPRIGDEYQVQIPKRMTNFNYQDSAVDILKTESSLKSQMSLDDEDLQFRCVHMGAYTEEAHRLSKLRSVADGVGKDDDSILSQKKDTRLDHRNKGCCSVCSSIYTNWKDIECKTFLLGLYTFGKNFRLVKKFVETREMSDVLIYYYGEFYKSSGYRRWSRSRKMKGARCIRKDKIYTGWRQKELLSRMFPHVSRGCRILLKKVARRFGDRKLSLEDYVFTLKNMVGTDLLVEAVAIGKEKEDLTGTTFDPAKINNVSIPCQEVPSGPAWSSLTKDQIIKCLRGECRLSKSELEDLFWKAIWPRLLARGWHSEQPRDYSHVGSKNSFVFLVPGILKFRRNLVKGRYCFDSISEVLKKVASDPEQLEPKQIEVDADKENCTSDRDPLNHHQHCHHQPHNQDFLKLTVVDTSSIRVNLVKVRNLESLPLLEKKLIDLNHPPLLPESGNAEPVFKSLSETSDHLEMVDPSDDVTEKEEPAIDTRRQSRRNQELTTKSFGTIALDLLGPKKKREGVNSMSRSSSLRQVRGKTVGRSQIDALGEDLAANQDDDTNMDEEFLI